MVSIRDHTDLVNLFQEFREFLKPKVINGVPEYTATAMKEKHRGLKTLQDRLAVVDISRWPISEQIDYHVVRAEMNGVDFDHRVLRPWARDPGFYNIIDGMYPRLLVHYTRMLSVWPLQSLKFPLPADKIAEFKMKLQAIPKIFEQAKENLTEAVKDFATIAIRIKEKEITFIKDLAAQLAEHHPDLLPDVEQGLASVKDFRDWLVENKSKMTAPAGIGKENYNWWLRNVQLIPYTWDDCLTIIQSDYNRAIAFLKLVENKNRKLPEFQLTSSKEENLCRQGKAAEELIEFLSEQEIITVPVGLKTLPPEHYPRIWGRSAYLRPGFRGFFEQCCDREPMTQVAHTFFGHYYVRDRIIWYQTGDCRPIRGVIRFFDMHEARSEALAFGIEEMLLQSGLLDNRQRAKEITYIWMAFRTARALSDLRMHSNEYTLMDGIENFVERLPYPWMDKDSDAAWWDMEETLRAPGHVVYYVVGKNQILQLLTDRANQLKDEFNLRQFMDEFMKGGIIPISLARWEMTELDDQIKKLW